jgi:dienelactone hydrolase
MQKKYDEGIKAFLNSNELGFDRPNSLYNIACCYSLIKQPDKSFEYLEKAVGAGFSDFDHAKTDSDLANVRADPRFEKIMRPKAAAPTKPATPATPYAAHPDAKPVTFSAADGVKVNAELYPAKAGKSAPIVLLFHQAGSNGAEYQTIAPKLAVLGYNSLAVDARSGGTRFGRDNLTVKGVGKSADYQDAYGDLEGALGWVKSEGYTGKIAAVGSSYSAGLVFRLASEHPEVAAILAFSPPRPGSGPSWKMDEWGKQAKAAVFLTASPEEIGALKEFYGTLPQKNKALFEQKAGVHGASTLREDKNPKGAEENFKAVAEFLKANVPT